MLIRILAAAALALAIAACGDGGFQRGVFYGKVIDKTPEEVRSAFGKPDSEDNSSPDRPRYIYNKKTFNPDNMNTVDEKTVVEFNKGPAGNFVCVDVSYM
jgi:hypothetical protein